MKKKERSGEIIQIFSRSEFDLATGNYLLTKTKKYAVLLRNIYLTKNGKIK